MASILSSSLEAVSREILSADDAAAFDYFFYLGQRFKRDPDARTFIGHWSQIEHCEFDSQQLMIILYRTSSVLSVAQTPSDQKADSFYKRRAIAEILQFLPTSEGMPVWYEKADDRLDEFNAEELSKSLDSIRHLSRFDVEPDLDFAAKATEKFTAKFDDFDLEDFATLYSVAHLADFGMTLDAASIKKWTREARVEIDDFSATQISLMLGAIIMLSAHGIEPDLDFVAATKPRLVEILATNRISPGAKQIIAADYQQLAPIEPGSELHMLLHPVASSYATHRDRNPYNR